VNQATKVSRSTPNAEKLRKPPPGEIRSSTRPWLSRSTAVTAAASWSGSCKELTTTATPSRSRSVQAAAYANVSSGAMSGVGPIDCSITQPASKPSCSARARYVLTPAVSKVPVGLVRLLQQPDDYGDLPSQQAAAEHSFDGCVRSALGDAPVQRYLPWRVADLNASTQITVRHLLYQVSGLSKATGNAYATSSDTRDSALRTGVGRCARPNSPSLWARRGSNSNANYWTLGMIVQAVSDQPYETYIQQHIFDPLQMRNSYTSRAEAEQHGLPTEHHYWYGFPVAAELPFDRGGVGRRP
jgi:Beta-lactamase